MENYYSDWNLFMQNKKKFIADDKISTFEKE